MHEHSHRVTDPEAEDLIKAQSKNIPLYIALQRQALDAVKFAVHIIFPYLVLQD